LTENHIEEIFEQVTPYVSDVEFIQNWTMSQIGRETAEIISELEIILNDEPDTVKKTDLRILLTTFEKL
jgi:hypothetical protein